jgi:hypothetical protein
VCSPRIRPDRTDPADIVTTTALGLERKPRYYRVTSVELADLALGEISWPTAQ